MPTAGSSFVFASMDGESRLDFVHIQTGSGPIRIRWTARDELLERLRAFGALEVVRAFEAVGATRPVDLTDDGKHVLLEVLSRWIDGELDDRRDGVAELRAALLDDLDAAGYWRD